tara:strand:- start:195 stop:1382 length:1188 start_codon:yes stop_codon:yes gene_type:complete
MSNEYLFTSESVTEGHPDKVCDQISDSILDAILEKDKNARVACETLTTTDFVAVSGEISSEVKPDYESIVRNCIKNIGYTDTKYGFDAGSAEVMLRIHRQSEHINQGVDREDKKNQGAGDQGLMFGFACNETPELMPLPIQLAHKLSKKLSDVRKEDNDLDWLLPDGKSQATILYDKYKPIKVDNIVLATQHKDLIDDLNLVNNKKDELEFIRSKMIESVIVPVLEDFNIDYNQNFTVNGTGRFVTGGPHGDTGLTGRKIIVDTYGGYARHGGGAFSGKDPSKVDRSAAYMSRYVAKNIVASGIADRCEVQLAYSIGVAEPVSILVDTFNTGKVSDIEITDAVKAVYSFKPYDIIERLNLCSPIYARLAAYGHLGRKNCSWEKVDTAEDILNNLK